MALLLGATDFLQRLTQPGPLSVWIRTTSTTSNHEILGCHLAASSTQGFGFILNHNGISGNILLYGKGAGGVIMQVGPVASNLNDGNWHHIGLNLWYAGVVNNQVWMDGALKGQAIASGGTWGGGTKLLRLGRSNDSFWGGNTVEYAECAAWGGGGLTAYHTPEQWAALAKGAPPAAVSLKEYHIHMPLNRSARDLVGFEGQPTLSGGTFTDQPRLIGGRP